MNIFKKRPVTQHEMKAHILGQSNQVNLFFGSLEGQNAFHLGRKEELPIGITIK